MVACFRHSEFFDSLNVADQRRAPARTLDLSCSPSLLVVCPHPEDLYRLDVIEDLIDKAMLNIQSAGARSCEVPDELLVWWWVLIGVG